MKKKEILKEQKKLRSSKNVKSIDFSEKDDVKKTMYIILGVVGFIALVFISINLFNGTWDLFSRKNDEETVFDTSLLMCGTLFKPTDDEYLVLAFKIEDEDDAIYGTLFEKYSGTKKLYYLDLKSGFNKGCLGEKNNFVNDSTKIKFGGQSLLHIKNGKIVKSYTTKDAIKTYLSK